MILGMLLNAPYPSDVRVRKEADALLQHGFKVHLLCQRRKNEPHQEVVGGIQVTRLDTGTGDYFQAFWDVCMAITFIHPIFLRALPVWVKSNQIEMIHVHDLPLAGTAFHFRKRTQIPVVCDFHENYPEALRAWFAWKKNPIARLKNALFMNPGRWSALEGKACHEADKVIAVVEEMKSRLVKQYQVAPEKITVISNTEDKTFIQQPQDPEVFGAQTGKFIVLYSGNIGPHRGVDTGILAMEHLRDRPDIVFIIVGSGGENTMNYLHELVAEKKLESVIFLGRQPFEKFYSFMKFASVNLIPHKSNPHTDNTIPHKLFQAMMVGRPLIVSSSDPLRRVVTQLQSGLVFEAGNAADLAKQIRHLADNPSLQQELGRNGAHATLEGTVNWDNEQKNLIALYSSLATRS